MSSEHGRDNGPLHCFSSPASVAVIGATDRPGSVGNTVLRNVLHSYQGRIYPVNPGRKEVCGLPCFSSVRTVPEAVDLVVIVIPAGAVPEAVAECVVAQAKSIVVISAGFKENGPEGAALEKEIRRHLAGSTTRLIGPNCLGLMNPLIGLNATFAEKIARPGNVAFLSQSGARPLAFVLFVIVGVMLLGAGSLLYLYSVVSIRK